jgi:hypothetical protein
MARPKKAGGNSGDQVVHLHVGKGETSDREVDDDELEALDVLEDGALTRAIEEVRQVEGAKAEVYRVSPADKQGHCRAYPVSMFTLERVAADYGPGKYRVRFKGPADKYIKGGSTFDIAEGVSAAHGSPQSPTGIQELLSFFKAQEEKTAAEREKRTSGWLEWAKILAPLALPKLLELLGGGSKGTSLPDMIRAVKDLKELQAPPQDLQSQFEQVVTILQGARELAGDGDAAKATGSTWVDLIRDAVQSPAAASFVQALTARSSPLPSHAVEMQQPTPVIAPPVLAGNSGSASNTVPGSSMIQQLQWLRATLSTLLTQAEKQANPRLYAEVVLDNLPRFVPENDLLERLSAENWFEALKQVDARVGAHEAWFQRFRDYCVRSISRSQRKAGSENVEPGPPVSTNGPPGVNQPMQEGDQFE